MFSDLSVDFVSDSLSDIKIDIVVTGSIGAIKSPLFIRSLRRLGAKITPWISEGGRKFITEESLRWAAGNDVISRFSASVSHLSVNDLVIIAPASYNFINSLSSGIMTSPSLSLVASCIGYKKLIIALPCMHDSLWNCPILQENISKLKKYIHFLEPDIKENKAKFPNSKLLADKCSHIINNFNKKSNNKLMITLGGTKTYIDDVRFVTNYSSGKLASLISEEIYRQGFETYIIAANHKYLPRNYSKIFFVEDNFQMQSVILKNISDIIGIVHVSAVLDFYIPDKLNGKISSKKDYIDIRLLRSNKILANIKNNLKIKIAFKLYFKNIDLLKTAKYYIEHYNLTGIFFNDILDIDNSKHKGVFFEIDPKSNHLNSKTINLKEDIALEIFKHINKRSFT